MSNQSQRVLIIDKSPENREVLRTMLRRVGIETIETKRAEQGLEIAKRWHPDVLVLDADTVNLDDTRVCDGFQSKNDAENTAVVVLGRISWEDVNLVPNQVVPKPYHYRPLIRKIEELLRTDAKPNH